MRLAVILFALGLALAGCQTSLPAVDFEANKLLGGGHSIPLDDYLGRQRDLNERYLYGTPQEALKAAEGIAELEEDYARNGQRPIDSDHARMLAYSRLFVLSERLRNRPEAESYMEKALYYARHWKPEVGALPQSKQVDFIRAYVDEFEKGLEVRWKSEVK